MNHNNLKLKKLNSKSFMNIFKWYKNYKHFFKSQATLWGKRLLDELWTKNEKIFICYYNTISKSANTRNKIMRKNSPNCTVWAKWDFALRRQGCFQTPFFELKRNTPNTKIKLSCKYVSHDLFIRKWIRKGRPPKFYYLLRFLFFLLF